MARIGSTRVCRVGRDRSFTARHGGWPCDWPLSHGSPTLKTVAAAGGKVGLVPVSVSTPDGLDRLLTLQNGDRGPGRRRSSGTVARFELVTPTRQLDHLGRITLLQRLSRRSTVERATG